MQMSRLQTRNHEEFALMSTQNLTDVNISGQNQTKKSKPDKKVSFVLWEQLCCLLRWWAVHADTPKSYIR